jgi:hypothetical protein
MLYKDLESKKEKITKYIRKNPDATYKEIRDKLHLKIERIYKGGMGEAFKDAGIKPPRNFIRKSREEKRNIIINYIRKNPRAGGHTIRRDTKINFSAIFNTTEEAFKAAHIKYNRKIDKRTTKQKKKHITGLIKKNPLMSITEVTNKTKTKPYNFFKNIRSIYKEAGIRSINGNEKRLIKKKQKVIEFIKNNQFATQREINKVCRTHVQELFRNGIFGAYKKAGVKFPYERLSLYGAALKVIKQKAKKFEDKIALKLSGYGKVSRLMKTRRGVADVIFERKGKKAVIEIKNYLSREISISQIKQLYRYLKDCNCKLGFLICPKKPKKDKFLIGGSKIVILKESELDKIPQLMKGL